MASQTSSVSRSTRYSSAFRVEAGQGTSMAFQPYCHAEPHRLFRSQGAETALNLSPFDRLGMFYSVSADVSQFEPEDVVVLAFNRFVIIHAEKIADDGSISDTFTHRTELPEDMDPLTVSGALTPEGVLVVRVRKTKSRQEHELPPPTYCANV